MQDLDHQQYHYYSASSFRDYCCHEKTRVPESPESKLKRTPREWSESGGYLVGFWVCKSVVSSFGPTSAV